MSPPEQTAAYDELVEAIVKAVPEIDYLNGQTAFPNLLSIVPIEERLRPITLEDVLRAIHKRSKLLHVNSYGSICEALDRHRWVQTGIRWDFGKPLSEQPPETIEFLHKLLV